MNRLKLIIRNAVIILILLLLFLNRTGLYLTPLSAHENSERSAHYGPSKVVHIEDFGKGKHILGKYDKWVSCNTVNRVFYFFWGFGNQVHGFENDTSKAIDFSYGASYEYYKLYGIINDENIKKVEITLSNGKIYFTTDFYEDLFIITWEETQETIDGGVYINNIRGYDKANNIIFDEDW